MAAGTTGSSKDRAGKKPHKNKPTSKKYSFYSLEGGMVKRARKSCARCGMGTFLAAHKGRMHCGKCNYTEFSK